MIATRLTFSPVEYIDELIIYNIILADTLIKIATI